MPASLSAYQYPGRPSLLLQLHDASPEILEPEKYSTDKTEQLQEQYLLSVFDIFVIWARNNRKKLTSWVELHSMPWVRDGHTSRVGRQYVFPVDRLREARPVDLNTQGIDHLILNAKAHQVAVQPETIPARFVTADLRHRLRPSETSPSLWLSPLTTAPDASPQSSPDASSPHR
jgi:hypothetical protein